VTTSRELPGIRDRFPERRPGGGSIEPVFEAQPGHARKLHDVAGDERCLCRERRGGDQDVVRADGLPGAFELGANVGGES
jgi:hypothetical protein